MCSALYPNITHPHHHPRRVLSRRQRRAGGDVGGFGVGAHTDWQVLGTIDYTLNSSWNLHLGYRSLNFDITGSEGRFGFNVHMRGPIFAGSERLRRALTR